MMGPVIAAGVFGLFAGALAIYLILRPAGPNGHIAGLTRAIEKESIAFRPLQRRLSALEQRTDLLEQKLKQTGGNEGMSEAH